MPKYSEQDLAQLKKLYTGLISPNPDDAPADPETAIRRTVAMMVGHKIVENQIENTNDPSRRAALQKMLDNPAMLKQVDQSPAFNIWYQTFDINSLHKICTTDDGLSEAMNELTDIQNEVKDKGKGYINARIAGAREQLWTKRSTLFMYAQENHMEPGRERRDEKGEVIRDNPWGLTSFRNALNSAAYGLMLKNGVPVEELFLPFKHFRKAQEAGREVCMRYYRASEEDKEWFTDQYVSASMGVSTYLDTKLNKLAGKPIGELLKPENADLGLYSSFLTDPNQELEHMTDTLAKKYGPEYLDELADRQYYLQAIAESGSLIGATLAFAKNRPGSMNASLREAFGRTVEYEYLSKRLEEDLNANPNKTSYIEGKGVDDKMIPTTIFAVVSSEGQRIEAVMKNGDPWDNLEELFEGNVTKELGLQVKVEEGVPEVTFDESARNERLKKQRELEQAEEARAEKAFIDEAQKKAETALNEDLAGLRHIVNAMQSEDENLRLTDPRGAVSRCLASLFAHKGLINGIGATDDLRQVAQLREKVDDPRNIAVIEKSPAFANYLRSVDPTTPAGLSKLNAILNGGAEVIEQEAHALGNLHQAAQPQARNENRVRESGDLAAGH